MAFTYIVPYAEEAGNISNTANITINNANVTNNANVGNNLTTSNLFVTNTANVAKLNANGNVSFTGSNVSLGNVSNLHITGGTANYFLQTDGNGNLTWTAVSTNTSNISNGNSNVSIPIANGNVIFNVTGTSNVMVISNTQANINGNVNSLNANLGNAVIANFYIGNGSLLTGINGSNVSNVANANYANFAGTLINGNSNISIVANSNIVVKIAGTANVVTFTSTGMNVAGNITSGNVYANSGTIGATSIAGTITTSPQPQITSLGNLVSANVTGSLIANIVYSNSAVSGVSGNFTGNSTVLSQIVINAGEAVLTYATGATGNIAFDIGASSLIYYTANATNNWNVDFQTGGRIPGNTSVTVALLAKIGSAGYYANAHSIDGTAITPLWQGNSPPTLGDANSIDAYTYSIIKGSSNTYTVLAAITQYK